LGCVMIIQAQQTRKRPRVAVSSEPDLQLSLHPALQGLTFRLQGYS
jgi:hypothetical protein